MKTLTSKVYTKRQFRRIANNSQKRLRIIGAYTDNIHLNNIEVEHISEFSLYSQLPNNYLRPVSKAHCLISGVDLLYQLFFYLHLLSSFIENTFFGELYFHDLKVFVKVLISSSSYDYLLYTEVKTVTSN